MMTVIFKDKMEVVVSDVQGQKIEQSIIAGAEFIRLEGELYSRSSIAKVIHGGQPPKPFVDPFERTGLPSGPVCKGQYSIQKEINNIARNDHPENWATLIRSKKWREQTRKELLEITDHWCDHKSNKCVCDQ